MGVRAEMEMLKRHLEVMNAVEEKCPIGISKLSQSLGMPVHKVRYSLRVLEEEGVVRPTEKGAVPTGRAESFKDEIRSELEELRSMIEGSAGQC